MKRLQLDRICLNYGDGVCSVCIDPKDFYAEHIKSSYRVPCLYFKTDGVCGRI